MVPCHHDRKNLPVRERIVDNLPFLVPQSRTGNATVAALCLTTKAASTSILRHVLGSAERRGIPLEARWFECPHGHGVIAHGLAPPRTLSFMVVRHPLFRLMSAYEEVRAKGLWHRLPRAQPNVSFAHAVHQLVNTPPKQVNVHFRALWATCGLMSGRRYDILRYENWGRLSRVLALHFAPNQPLLAFHDTDALARANQLYTHELAALANRWTRVDFAMFGYAPWWPGEPLPT